MTVLVSDSFNRADSATSLGTTDSYNGGTAKTWAMYGPSASLPTYGISSNQAYMVSNNGGFTNGSFAGMNVGVSDVTYSITLATAAAACYFVLRASDNNHYILVGTGNPYTVKTYSNGTFTTLASASVSSATGDVVSVTLNGSSITVSKNGTQIISTTSTFNQTSTIFGFSGQGSTATRFDNFQVEDLNTGGTTLTVSLSDSVTLSEIISKSPSKRLSDAITLSDTLSKNLTVTVVDAVSMGDTSTASQGGKSASLNDTVIVTDAIVKKVISTFKNDAVNLSDVDNHTAMQSLFDNITLTDSITHFLPGGPQLIGTITLKGNQQLNVYLVGNQALNVNLKGVIN